MNGEIPLEEVFIKRLEIIKPDKKDLQKIADIYLQNITIHADTVIKKLQKANHRVFIITGGYNTCIRKIVQKLKIKHVFANQIIFNPDGTYQKLNQTIPLWKNTGKAEIVKQIKQKYPHKTIMIGNSISDLQAGADQFICFTGVVARKNVIKQSKYVITDLRKVINLINIV